MGVSNSIKFAFTLLIVCSTIGCNGLRETPEEGFATEATPTPTPDVTAPDAATGLGWSVSSPSTSTSLIATWTKSNSSDLANQKIQFYSDALCTTTSGSLIDLNSATSATHTFTGTDQSTYSFKVTSLDAAGNSSISACSSNMLVDLDPCNPVASPFGGGDGAVATPYLVCSVTQLLQISDLTKNYKLKADLDLTSISFLPLGTYAAGYSGVFDGANHMISNWTYAAANLSDGAATIQAGTTHADYAVGFFRSLQSGAIVKNLTLSNVSIKGRYFTGGLTGYMKTGSLVDGVRVTTSASSGDVGTATTGIIIGFNDIPTAGGSTGRTGGVVGEMQTNSTVTNSSFDGWVRGAMNVGGLVGSTTGVISNSHTSGAIKGRDGNSGGFVGDVSGVGSIVSGSYSTATMIDIAGNSGGFVGSVNADGFVTTSYYNGNMTGASMGAGGFVGYVIGTNAKITKCYSSGTVTGPQWVGGFAGWVTNGGAISDSYSTSNVTSTQWAASFVAVMSYSGNTGGSVTRSYAIGTATSGGAYAADFLGYTGSNGSVSNSFSLDDSSVSGFVNTQNGASVTGSSSLTSSSLKDSATYTGSAGWDFTNVWQIDPAVNNGYPTLR